MGGRAVIAIDLGSRRLRALLAERGERRLRVKQVLTAALPTGPGAPKADDAEALGRWVGERLREAAIPKGNAIFAMSREQVVLKRVTLPTTVDAELPEMTRLAIQQDLPFAPAEAVIDFVPLSREGAGTVVLAVAIRAEMVSFVKRLAKAAGLGVEGISLRSMGAAALARGRGSTATPPPAAQTGPGPAASSKTPDAGRLIVDIAGEAVEFTVIDRGAIRFSRAAPLAESSDIRALAEIVATETRRTWLSYRVAEDSQDVGAAIVLGERELAERAARPIGQLLHVPAEVLEQHPLIDQSRASVEGAWSLAGLLLQPLLHAPTIDFARPRKAPDAAARRRQLILAGVGMAIVASFGAWTVGHRQLQGLQERAGQLERRAVTARPEHDRFVRDQDKLTHLQRWESIHADWLAHLAHLNESSPPPQELVWDGWNGTITATGISWDKKKDAWSSPMHMRITLDGEAKSRATADAYRDALVRDERYTTSSSGSDSPGGRRLPHPFMYILETSRPTPLDEGAAAIAGSGAAGAGAANASESGSGGAGSTREGAS